MQRVRRFPQGRPAEGTSASGGTGDTLSEPSGSFTKRKGDEFRTGGICVPGCRDLFEVLQQPP